MNASWSDGYVTDVEYVHGAFRETSPAMMRLALLSNGFAAPDFDAPFRYLELGAGQGTGLVFHAASHPNGEFHGVDFNPTHVAKARRFAKDAGIENVHFHERSFNELDDVDLGEFDVVQLHGVWSWVSEESRRAIVGVLRKRLRAGGIAYVSYNALPGWAARVPLQHLIQRHASRGDGPIGQRFQAAVAFAEKTLALRTDSPVHRELANYIGSLFRGSRAYAIHELMNEHWCALHHDEVAAALAPARLTFATSAIFANLFAEPKIDAEARKLLVDVSPALRESTRDFLLDTSFRSDLYLRGPVREGTTALRALWVVGRTSHAEFTLEQNSPGNDITVSEDLYGPLLDALAGEPKTIGELADLKVFKRVPFADITHALVCLVALEAVQPALDPTTLAARAPRTTRVNRVLADTAVIGGGPEYLVSPVFGAAFDTGRPLQLFVLAAQTGKDPKTLAWSVLRPEGFRLLRDGAPMSEADTEKELAVQGAIFNEKTVPELRRIGVLV